ncbi:hypothetical protein J4209_02730 [Candidatus Woesearchaeota archaeon]|nr:hypothetical protein [Candidatus Woesearchaeota archaeon]
MQNLKILNKKETKGILDLIKKQWGCDVKLDYAFLQNEKGRVFIVDKDVFKIDLKKIRINSIGLYFAEVGGNEIRLSIEGSQIIGPEAKKNVIDVDEKEAREWLKGYDLEKEVKAKGFAIIKYREDYLGTGKVRDNKIFNFVPKNRRLRVSD